MRALFASALRQHTRVFLSPRNAGCYGLHADGRRYFADKGPGRRDYTDPGFQKQGYIDPGCFAYTQRLKFRKADRGNAKNSHFLYSSGEMDVFKVKDCSFLRKRHVGDARREFEKSKEAPSKDAPPSVYTFTSAAPQNRSSAGFNSAAPENRSSAGFNSAAPQNRSSAGFNSVAPENRSSAGFNSAAPQNRSSAGFNSAAPQNRSSDGFNSAAPQNKSSAGKRSERDPSAKSSDPVPKAPGTRRGYKGAVTRNWSNFDYPGSRLDEFSKRMAAKQDKNPPAEEDLSAKKMTAKKDKDDAYTMRTRNGAEEFFERWAGRRGAFDRVDGTKD